MSTQFKTYTFDIQHDSGTIRMSYKARNEAEARKHICNFELCPNSALTLVDLPELEIGCHFDSHRGIYQGEAVIELALEYGFEVEEDDEENCHPSGEFYCELWEEAENFLDDFAPHGYYFGQNENGDSGVWSVENCDQCDATFINGVFCHEYNCPNSLT